MDREAAQLFFALLSIAAIVAVVGLLSCRFLATRWSPARAVVEAFSTYALVIAAGVALLCTGGSLYFSEVANYVPCTLCWYQRIAMYPLGLLFTLAALRNDRTVRTFATPLATIGAAISLYHWLLERFPNLDAGVCSTQVPCEFVWFEEFGFITLPFMALVGFIAIITITSISVQEHHDIPTKTPQG